MRKQMKLIFIFAILITIFQSSAFLPFATAGGTGKVIGRVIDQRTWDPMRGVHLGLKNHHTGIQKGAITDSGGRFYFLNVDVGQYDLSVSANGYTPMTYTNLTVNPDFTTTVEFEMIEEPIGSEAWTKTYEAPVIRYDQTGTMQIASDENIARLPLRDFQEVVALQSGITRYLPRETAVDHRELIMRGGRADQIDFRINGISLRDPLTGQAVAPFAFEAIQQMTTQNSGFTAEYGRSMSGIVNMTGKGGGSSYHLSIGGLSDNVIGSKLDDNNYNFSVGGPILPLKQGHNYDNRFRFFVAGQRSWQADHAPRNGVPTEYFEKVAAVDSVEINGQMIPTLSTGYNSVLDDLTNERLAHNDRSGRSLYGKIDLDITKRLKIDLTAMESRQEWQQYRHEFAFNLEHTPYYKSQFRAWDVRASYDLCSRAFITVGGTSSTSEWFRGDGVHRKDLFGYGRPNGNPWFDATTLFWTWDDMYGPTETIYEPFEWNPEIYE